MHGPSFSDARILLVDDTAANVRLLERVLERAGYVDIVSTMRPDEVVRLYQETQPDLILLDLHMPGMSGFEVMEALREVVDPTSYLPILVLTGDIDREARDRALSTGARDFLTKPFDQAEILLRIRNLLETRHLHLELRKHNEQLEHTVAQRTAALVDAIARVEKAQQRLKDSHEETVRRLSIAAEFRDESTGAHIQRMSRYCALLVSELGGDQERCEIMRLASQMHDVGKIGIPDSILLKPGSLTTQERQVMQRHADIGFRILSGSTSDLVATAATIAWTHHERMDGSGYPRGLSGDDIPLEGRIAAIADVFDAITTDRVYKSAIPISTAESILQRGSGKHFDSVLVEAFLDSMPAVREIRQEFFNGHSGHAALDRARSA
jgi:putative two-component system response regulator